MNVKDLKEYIQEIPEDTPVYVGVGLKVYPLANIDYRKEDGIIYGRGVYLDTELGGMII